MHFILPPKIILIPDIIDWHLVQANTVGYDLLVKRRIDTVGYGHLVKGQGPTVYLHSMYK